MLTPVAHTRACITPPPEAELTHDEALAVLRECGSGWLGDRREGTGGACWCWFWRAAAALRADTRPRAAPTSALDLLVQERNRRCIKTLCPELDDLLGGGVAPGEITECVACHHVDLSWCPA